MARKLTRSQIKLIDRYKHIYMKEDLPEGVLEKVVKLNDYETVYQDIDRLLGDNYTIYRYHLDKR